MERLSTEGLRQAHYEGQVPAPQFRRGTEVAASSEVRVTRQQRPASPESVEYLRKLVAERYPSASEEFVASVIAEGQARVSKAIDKLKTMPKVAQAPKVRVNRYPGTCEHCGTRVAAEEGTLTLSDEDKWEVAHRPGECPVSEYPFPVGRYAVENAEGTLRFYAATHEGFFVMASDELHPVPAGTRASIIAKIAEDPEAASRAYGREIKVCGRCGRKLTDEVSRAQGIGPVCMTKGW